MGNPPSMMNGTVLTPIARRFKMNDFDNDELWFDALEDFRGPEITAEEMDWTVSDADYEAWLDRRSEKLKGKTARDHEAETRAKTLAFYMNDDNILNERSLW